MKSARCPRIGRSLRRWSLRPCIKGWGFRWTWNFPGRRGGRSRWWIEGRSRFMSCSKLVLLLTATSFAADLSILPPKVELVGPEARQQLLAQATEDLTRLAKWSSSDEKVAKVSAAGVVEP